MTRYNIVSDSGCGNCVAEKCPDGEYVEFAVAVAAIREAVAEEREACAKVADAALGQDDPPVGVHPATWHGGWANCVVRGVAASIRARG